MRRGVDVDDGAVGHDCFPANDVVGGHTFLAAEEGETELE